MRGLVSGLEVGTAVGGRAGKRAGADKMPDTLKRLFHRIGGNAWHHHGRRHPIGTRADPARNRILSDGLRGRGAMRRRTVKAALLDIADEFVGSISVEHGIGVAKRAAFEDRIDPVARDLWVLLKGCSILKTF